MEDTGLNFSMGMIQGTNVNQTIKSCASAEDARFLLRLSQKFHTANFDKDLRIGDWVQLGVICLQDFRETIYSVKERITLITNELYDRDFTHSQIRIFYIALIDSIEYMADTNFIPSKKEIRKSIDIELKRLHVKENQEIHDNGSFNYVSEENLNKSLANPTQNATVNKNKSVTLLQDTGGVDFAATLLLYKPRYIRELCRTTDIPHTKPKGKYIFRRKDLEDWILKNDANSRKKGLMQIGRQIKRRTA